MLIIITHPDPSPSHLWHKCVAGRTTLSGMASKQCFTCTHRLPLVAEWRCRELGESERHPGQPRLSSLQCSKGCAGPSDQDAGAQVHQDRRPHKLCQPRIRVFSSASLLRWHACSLHGCNPNLLGRARHDISPCFVGMKGDPKLQAINPCRP
jgi:hypothetical protein